MTTVKQVVASKYSDGGTDKTVPPTPADRAMTVKHTTDSIPYNLHHAKDHLDELVKQLARLAKYDKGKSVKLARQVCDTLGKIQNKVEAYEGGPHKENY